MPNEIRAVWPDVILSINLNFGRTDSRAASVDFSRVDYTSRLFRQGKAAISQEVEEILERLGTTAVTWLARLDALRKCRLSGSFFAVWRFLAARL